MTGERGTTNGPWRCVRLRSWPALLSRFLVLVFCVLAVSFAVQAETCLTASDMDAATRSALENTARRYFDMASRGDTASLRQNAIPSVASSFSGIEAAVKDNQANFAGAQATPRPPFLLQAPGTAPIERAEFFCGVFGRNGQTADSAEFILPNLPPGNYGIVILDVTGGKVPNTLSFVLAQQGAEWKLGGFFAKAAQVSGHDGKWFLQKADEFKAKGQLHNAWFYYIEARDLMAPVPFMSTLATDKVYDLAQSARPSDLPGSSPVDLVAGAKTYKVTTFFPLVVGNDLELVVKYQSADVSNTTQAFQDNMAVTKALVSKYPEYREAFAGIVARAVESSGRDYGSLMPMKDIK